MNVKITVPDDIYHKAAEAAREQNVSLEDVLETAVIEHVRALDALRCRAARGSIGKFRAVMDRVPDIDPDPHDRF